MITRTEFQPYPLHPPGPSLPELLGLVAFLTILVSGLVGLLRYGLR
jgi:hypothetical protein